MSSLYQLQLAFDPIQDRLLLKFHTKDFAEFRVWLTRRYVKLLWATLMNLLQTDQKDNLVVAEPEQKEKLVDRLVQTGTPRHEAENEVQKEYKENPQQFVKELQEKEAQKVEESYEAERDMKQNQAAQKFSQSISRKPLGTEPILVTRVQIKKDPQGMPVLCMHPEEGQGFEITATSMVIHSLCKLLAETVGKAGWDLPLAYPTQG